MRANLEVSAHISAGHWGWFGIAALGLLFAFTASGMFVTLEEWLDPLKPLHKFWVGFFQLHIPMSTYRGYVAAKEDHRKHALVAKQADEEKAGLVRDMQVRLAGLAAGVLWVMCGRVHVRRHFLCRGCIW